MGIINFLRNLFVVPGRNFDIAPRSNKWPTVRKHYLEKHPACEVCGHTKDLQVHHCKPFHLNPSLELDETNLITLCERGEDGCHLIFGHLYDFHAFNPNVREDAAAWAEKIKNRKYE